MRALRRERCVTVPATEIAREHLGRPLPNAALLGAFAALTGQVSLTRSRRRSASDSPGRTAEGNVAAAEHAHALVLAREEGDRMRSQIEGSQAVARAVALCRPEVVSAYPISPQTHIVEALSDLVRTGELAPCEYLMVESEFAALSAAIGASAAGARTYTATASQGLLYMAEALYNASGLGLPIVMTIANRAIGAPINIWNDHSDVMSQRDCGWIQLFAESNQEAVDLHVQAFALAEELSLPVTVNMDGFVLTHAVEPVDLPSQAQVDAFLPPFEPRQVLDPDEPVTIGAMVGPEAFTEVKVLMHAKQMQALDVVPRLAADFEDAFGRGSGGLLRTYRARGRGHGGRRARLGAGNDRRGSRRAPRRERDVAALGIKCFRPWPLEEIRQALQGARRVIVLEKAFAVGIGGIVGQNVRLALSGLPVPVFDVVAGLGGRPITKRSLHTLLADVLHERIEPNQLTFLDLDRELVQRELHRVSQSPRSGPARREHPARRRHRRGGVPLRRRRCRRRSSSTNSEPSPPATGCSIPTSEASRQTSSGRTRSRRVTARARDAARRSARATSSTRPCAPPAGSWSRPTRRAASRSSRLPIRSRPGSSPGCTRCSATRLPSARASLPP